MLRKILYSSFLILMFINLAAYSKSKQIPVQGIFIHPNGDHSPLLTGQAKINTIKEPNNPKDLIKATVHWLQDEVPHVAQSNPLRFNNKTCLNKSRLDLNEMKGKSNICISLGSGSFWLEGPKNRKRQNKFTAAHYYDPESLDFIFINLGYDEEMLTKVLFFVSYNIKWVQVEDFLNTIHLLSELDTPIYQTIKSNLYPTLLEVE